MKLFTLIFFLFLFILHPQSVKCDVSENDRRLDGHWISNCQKGKISEMIVDNRTSFLREGFYQEADCHTLLFFIETTGIITYPLTETIFALDFKKENHSRLNSCNTQLNSKKLTPSNPKLTSFQTMGHLNQFQISNIVVNHAIGEFQHPSNQAHSNTLSFSQNSLVDYSYQEVAIRPLNLEITSQFNKSRMCDINTWTTMAPTTITGKHCRFVEGARPIQIPYYQQNRFGIFKILEPFLYFGQNNLLEDSSSPSRRPKDINPEPFGKRY